MSRDAQPPYPKSRHMCFALHLFELARINSEIKYVANSVDRDVPAYALSPPDYQVWQGNVLQRLDAWVEAIPTGEPDQEYPRILCHIRYHNIRMLLMSPSPGIPSPSPAAWEKCFHSAVQGIRLYKQLYGRDMFTASWSTLHSITICAITVMYCVRVNPSIALQAGLDMVNNDISTSLSLLSAIGEHWSAARRCWKIVDKLGELTQRWVKERFSVAPEPRWDRSSSGPEQAFVTPSSISQHMMADDGLNTSGLDLMDSTVEAGVSVPSMELNTILDQILGQGQSLLNDSADSQFPMSFLFEDFIASDLDLGQI